MVVVACATEVAMKEKDAESGRERYSPSVVLDLDYVGLVPRRAVIV